MASLAIEYSKKAIADLRSIEDYTTRIYGPRMADRYLSDMNKGLKICAIFPESSMVYETADGRVFR